MVIRPLIPAPVFRRYKRWRRGQNPPWHSFSVIRPEFAAQCKVMDRAASEDEHFDSPPIRDPRLARIRDFRIYCESADWYAKVRASFRLDIRTPAFDRRLVEFCVGIPLNQYLREGRDRWLIRRAMAGRLPDMVLNQKKFGAQAADWYPRLARERNHIAEEVKRLAENPEVASVLDMQRLHAILDSWPDRQPAEFTPEENLMLGLPDTLGAAYFIKNLTAANYPVAGNAVA